MSAVRFRYVNKTTKRQVCVRTLACVCVCVRWKRKQRRMKGRGEDEEETKKMSEGDFRYYRAGRGDGGGALEYAVGTFSINSHLAERLAAGRDRPTPLGSVTSKKKPAPAVC